MIIRKEPKIIGVVAREGEDRARVYERVRRVLGNHAYTLKKQGTLIPWSDEYNLLEDDYADREGSLVIARYVPELVREGEQFIPKAMIGDVAYTDRNMMGECDMTLRFRNTNQIRIYNIHQDLTNKTLEELSEIGEVLDKEPDRKKEQ